MVASFGRVADMGREVGETIRMIAPLMTGEVGSLSPDVDEAVEEKAMKGFFKIMAWAPEIGEMEQNADEIATFQSRALGDLFGFGKGEVEALHPIVASHFAKMAAAELTIAHQPAEEDVEGRELWRQGRGTALQNLMRDLRPTLPDTIPKSHKKAMAAVLNIGAGIVQERGNVAIVPWPDVPW